MEWSVDSNQEKLYSQKSLELNICLCNKEKTARINSCSWIKWSHAGRKTNSEFGGTGMTHAGGAQKSVLSESSGSISWHRTSSLTLYGM